MWSQETREFICGETIVAYWTYTHILLVVLQAKTHNYCSVTKAKGKLKECFEELGVLFKSMKIDENPKEMVAPDIKDISDNLDNDEIDETSEGKLDNSEEMVEDDEDKESNE